jgi:hypothetical protein
MGLVTGPPNEPSAPRVRLHSELRDEGVTRGRMANRRRYRHIARKLYVEPDQPDNLIERCRALSLILPTDAVFSHYTAAALWKAVVPNEPQIHICTESPIEPRIKGVVGHRIRTIGEVQVIHGVRVTTPGRTYLDLAGFLDLLSHLIAADGLAQRDPRGVEGLRAAVLAGSGRRGIKQARLVLPLINPAAKSAPETRLRFLVVTDGLGVPLVNQPVYDAAGEWLCEPDLHFPEFKVAIEYEGEHHRRDPDQWQRDIRRDELLRANGWILIKVTARDLFTQPAITLARIRDALLSRGWRP